MTVRRAALLAVLLLSSTPALADDAPASGPPSDGAPPASTTAPSSTAAPEPSSAPSSSVAPAPSVSTTAGSDPTSFLLPVEPIPTAPLATSAAVSPSTKATASVTPSTPTPPVPTSTADRTVKLNTPMEVGLSILSLTYLPSLIAGIAMEEPETLPLAIPIGGPLITAAILKPEDWGWAVFGSLSALQLIGAGIFTLGVLLPGDPPPKKTTQTWHIRATPVAGPSTWGLSVQGAF